MFDVGKDNYKWSTFEQAMFDESGGYGLLKNSELI